MAPFSPSPSSRRHFLAHSAAAFGGTLTTRLTFGQNATPAAPSAPGPDANGIVWHDVSEWGIEGRGWPVEDMERPYARLPRKAKGIVRDAVWSLSQDSAGMLTRFQTDATTIHVRYTLRSERLGMAHMPATGVSGIDLYALDSEKRWRWLSVFRPGEGKDNAGKNQSGKLAEGIDPGLRAYTAYLPLYNGIDKLEFGFPTGAKTTPIAPRKEKPIIFYGTSITHGACASRPGMVHTAILGRRLDRPVINLGFSGNGKMEPEMAALLAELDPAVFVLDCLPNMVVAEVTERAEPFVRQLRETRPDTPIVMVEDRTYGYAWAKQSARERHQTSRSAYIRAFDNLIASGVKGLQYLEGAALLGTDDEATTDGSHPNDLGFVRQADAFEPILRQALDLPQVKEV
ncbi:MAG: SGNH/GDSL hydrolase family protein [Verrucomicrobiales bacterium]|nr:SGNH/GDSL hydrolase family protein [Verrucomicrobiales bacterium]